MQWGLREVFVSEILGRKTDFLGYSKPFFAKREMFSALKRLEVFESQTTQ